MAGLSTTHLLGLLFVATVQGVRSDSLKKNVLFFIVECVTLFACASHHVSGCTRVGIENDIRLPVQAALHCQPDTSVSLLWVTLCMHAVT